MNDEIDDRGDENEDGPERDDDGGGDLNDLADEADLADLGYEPPSPPIIAIEAHLLHRASEADALAAFDEIVGTPAVWSSALLHYRARSEWQRDWKIEAGHWLVTAKRLGYADWIRGRL